LRYWWVNQNQTYRHEVAGGYLWSPKRKSNGARNPYYEFMREVAPGDLVFSFADTRIRAYGVTRSHAYEAPKPLEFGAAGRNWDEIGWRVDVAFQELSTVFRPVDWIERLRGILPQRYSPLRPNGHGVQNMYLTELPQPLALALADLIGTEVAQLARSQTSREWPLTPSGELVLWEEHLRRQIERDTVVAETEKHALILARRGQGLFRSRVELTERRCRITGVDRPEHLRASHIKPWRDCQNADRLDGENGLLLTPSIDHLFDRGFISFKDDGQLLVSPVAHGESLRRMGIDASRHHNVGSFTTRQCGYLDFHRDAVFLQARVRS
jgi:hypothetical protein